MLRSPGLNARNYVTTYQAETIWIQEQLFILYVDTWHWVYGIENIVIRSTYTADLVFQKIGSLNALVKSLEEISNILKKDFIHLSLNKKNIKKLQASFD